MNRHQRYVIDYLVEENRMLREQLDVHAKGKHIRFNASVDAWPRKADASGARLWFDVFRPATTERKDARHS